MVATEKVVALTDAALVTVANELCLCADNICLARDAANGIIEAKVVEIQDLPFFSAMQSTEEVVHLATVEGVMVTERALSVVKNNPSLVVAECSIAGAAKDVIRQTKILSTKRTINFTEKQLQRKFKHAKVFGIKSSWNKEVA